MSVSSVGEDWKVCILPERRTGFFPDLRKPDIQAWNAVVSALQKMGLSKEEAVIVREQVQIEVSQRSRMQNDIHVAKVLFHENGVLEGISHGNVALRSLVDYLVKDIETPSLIVSSTDREKDTYRIMVYMYEGPRKDVWQGEIVWYGSDEDISVVGLIEVRSKSQQHAIGKVKEIFGNNVQLLSKQ